MNKQEIQILNELVDLTNRESITSFRDYRKTILNESPIRLVLKTNLYHRLNGVYERLRSVKNPNSLFNLYVNFLKNTEIYNNVLKANDVDEITKIQQGKKAVESLIEFINECNSAIPYTVDNLSFLVHGSVNDDDGTEVSNYQILRSVLKDQSNALENFDLISKELTNFNSMVQGWLSDIKIHRNSNIANYLNITQKTLNNYVNLLGTNGLTKYIKEKIPASKEIRNNFFGIIAVYIVKQLNFR